MPPGLASAGVHVVNAMTFFDDGTGRALYVAGSFSVAGGVLARNVARWDGERWSAVGEGLEYVLALAVFDDGDGPALYAGGGSSMARWDGRRWSEIPNPTGRVAERVFVSALAALDVGSGPALYAASTDWDVEAASAQVDRWDGKAWFPLGSLDAPACNRIFFSLSAFDDGTGPGLYVGGVSSSIRGGCEEPFYVLRWDGEGAWEPLGEQGWSGSLGVQGLEVFDDGTGSALYAGGAFSTSVGGPTTYLARWEGEWWDPLGIEFRDPFEGVYALEVYNEDAGPTLYAAGQFRSISGIPARNIARFDGTTWSTVGQGADGWVRALLASGEDGLPVLFAGGSFSAAGGSPANCVARWDGEEWSALTTGGGLGPSPGDTHVLFIPTSELIPGAALEVFDDGGGQALYAAGDFTTAGGSVANHVARYDGEIWEPLGSGTDGPAWSLAVFDDGQGAALYVGGRFSAAGGSEARNIARWDGRQWAPLGAGLRHDRPEQERINALAVFDDGSGPALYAGGAFNSAGGAPALRIARWDGRHWTGVGGGLEEMEVGALEVFDDGSGAALYAGGHPFASSGPLVMRWDGSRWSRPGDPDPGRAVSDGLPSEVLAFAVFDDGTGPALYAGGWLSRDVLRWDGTEWKSIGGMSAQTRGDRSILALEVFDQGDGPALYAAGEFTMPEGVSGGNIARWDGEQWSSLGSGTDGLVRALAVFDDGNGPALYAGGHFTSAGRAVSAHVARWEGGVSFLEIREHPADQLACEGERVSLRVEAEEGAASLEYQWRREEVPIEGATGTSYTIESATAEDAGLYDVIVSSPCSSTVSRTAMVDVAPCATFHRGDPDGEGESNISDAVFIFRFLFLDGDTPSCLESADVDNSGEVEITDGIVLLDWLFLGGPPPAEPGPPGAGPCGFDPDAPGSPGDLGCEAYSPCR